MALKKDSKSLGSEQEKSQNEDSSRLEFKNLDNKEEIESQLFEVSKGCLLYTSPSPRDRQKSRMPSSA